MPSTTSAGAPPSSGRRKSSPPANAYSESASDVATTAPAAKSDGCAGHVRALAPPSLPAPASFVAGADGGGATLVVAPPLHPAVRATAATNPSLRPHHMQASGAK